MEVKRKEGKYETTIDKFVFFLALSLLLYLLITEGEVSILLELNKKVKEKEIYIDGRVLFSFPLSLSS